MAIKFLNTVAVDTDVLFVDAAANKVGIGTDSPGAKLEVSTDGFEVAKFAGNTDDGTGYVGAVVEIESNNDVRGRGVYLTHRNSADTGPSEWYAGVPYIGGGYSIGNAAYGTSVNSNTGPAHKDQSKVFIEESGDVGIGTTSPARQLTLGGAAPVLSLHSTSTTGESSIYFGDTADDNEGRIVYSNSQDVMQIWTAAAERIRVTSAGHVGIGATNPDVMLDVVTTTYANSFVDIQNLKYTTFDVLKFGYTGSTGSIRTGTIDSGIFGFAVNTGDGTERMRINTIGNVGIGTNDPDAKLHVKSSNSGATTQSGTLIVEAGSAPSIQILSANSQTQSIKFGDPQDGDAGRISYSHSTNDMTLVTNGGERIRVTSAGDTGIGVTTPRAKLDVAGGVKVADDTDAAVANKVGTLRYRYVPGSPKNFSYVDMCMQTGTNSYAWVNIVQNVWN